MADLIPVFYERLLAHHGAQHWWPAQSPWEVTVGAILTQNTNWRNVERAIAQLVAHHWLDPAAILAAAPDELALVIRPAGYHRVKARRLQAIAAWWQQHRDAAADPARPLAEARATLLAVHGVGPETADSILLYACQRPATVVDTYTTRIFARHGLVPPRAAYHHVQQLIDAQAPAGVAWRNEFHALLVAVGKAHCHPTPTCAGCPLAWHPHAV